MKQLLHTARSKPREHICKNCGVAGQGNYCATCGEKYLAAKITVASMTHQVVHFFTHVDRGFGYTVKQLAKHPGKMQREYIDGVRSKYQKPFPFFFVCGTICGIAFYFLYIINGKLRVVRLISQKRIFSGNILL